MAEEEKKTEEKPEAGSQKPEGAKGETAPAAAPSSSSEVNFMGIMAYLGPLCLVPLLTEKKDEFIKFHVKQGMVLFIGELIVWAIFWFLFSSITFSWSTMSLWSMLSMVQNVLYLGVGILSIVGIVNVLNGAKKELPYVGKYASKITFVK